MALVERQDKFYGFARVLLLFYLQRMTTSSPGHTEFVFEENFGLNPLLNNV